MMRHTRKIGLGAALLGAPGCLFDPSSSVEVAAGTTDSSGHSASGSGASGSGAADGGAASTVTTGAGAELDTAGSTGPAQCDAPVEVPIVAPAVALVLDKSGSMGSGLFNLWDHDGDPQTPLQTRWESLHAVVAAAAIRFDRAMNLGLVLFPATWATGTYDEGACPVSAFADVPVGPRNAAAIVAVLPPAQATSEIQGATPTALAIATARDELQGVGDDRPRYIVLVTDGAANCHIGAPDGKSLLEVYDPDVLPAVADALAAGIPTHVVGIGVDDFVSTSAMDGQPDKINPHAKLDELAVAGGVPRDGQPRFFDARDEAGLRAALETIAAEILDCTVDLDAPPGPDEIVEVSVGGRDFGATQVSDCDITDGWRFTTKERDRIALCGQACADFRVEGALWLTRCPGEP